jgi:hypothetical protein
MEETAYNSKDAMIFDQQLNLTKLILLSFVSKSMEVRRVIISVQVIGRCYT